MLGLLGAAGVAGFLMRSGGGRAGMAGLGWAGRGVGTGVGWTASKVGGFLGKHSFLTAAGVGIGAGVGADAFVNSDMFSGMAAAANLDTAALDRIKGTVGLAAGLTAGVGYLGGAAAFHSVAGIGRTAPRLAAAARRSRTVTSTPARGAFAGVPGGFVRLPSTPRASGRSGPGLLKRGANVMRRLGPGRHPFITATAVGAAAGIGVGAGASAARPRMIAPEGNIVGIQSNPTGRGGISPELQFSTQGLPLRIHNSRVMR